MVWYSEFILWVLGATIKFAGKRKFIWNGEDTVVDKEKVDSINGNVFRIEKLKPFDDKKLSTIQTVISKL